MKFKGTFRDDYLVEVKLHQISMVSPLLFIIVLGPLSREIRSGCPNEALKADD